MTYDPNQHGGRSERHQRANEDACEVIFIAAGLCGIFAWGYFAGQFLIGLLFGWWAA